MARIRARLPVTVLAALAGHGLLAQWHAMAGCTWLWPGRAASPNLVAEGGQPLPGLLVESALPAELDWQALGHELTAQRWTDETLLVKVLLQQGAREVVTRDWAGQSRNMSFKLSLGIPWGKINRYLRVFRKGADSAAADGITQESSGISSVDAVHKIAVRPNELLTVDSTYLVPALSLRLHLQFGLRWDSRLAAQAVKYTFSGFIGFDSHAGAFSYSVIRRFTEMGFMEAAKVYGEAVLGELQARCER
eukprot:CAMPEP_0168413936 /NCGR_PEP_ID=MMETSP0228-20121227/29471_1 /TAXON_ID=133427 /ORGANISM="Protoceratium reticulatum, Strain CCCM 535 (=CCMP 1889)" /LENGTH=248 /DNA_ID=CAMNT_0008427725 /DNA_START=29 /DNA_END=775 /DNA_ORIENTATION=-